MRVDAQELQSWVASAAERICIAWPHAHTKVWMLTKEKGRMSGVGLTSVSPGFWLSRQLPALNHVQNIQQNLKYLGLTLGHVATTESLHKQTLDLKQV